MPFRLHLAIFAATVTLSGITPAAPPAINAISKALDPFLGSEISGAVTLVAENDKVVHFDAQGFADQASERKMRADDLFWIASMTKPITGAAVLMLQDEGKLQVDDLVEKHLPEFANLWMVEEQDKQRRLLKRPARRITLKNLLTHTAGVPNLKAPRAHTTLGELVAQGSQLPLHFEPGSKWSYSNAGINTLGRVVEVVSGQPFEDFLQQRIFDPLGMKDTTFFPAGEQLERLATAYQKSGPDEKLTPTTVHFIQGDYSDKRRTVIPAGGLFSTADDLLTFYRMMLAGGEWHGRRLLSKEAVHQLTTTQTGEIVTGFTDGMSWGLGFQVVKHPQGVTAMLSPGTFGHGGAYGTQSWADPARQRIYILMIQRRGFRNGDNSPVRMSFQRAAADALDR